MNLKVGILEELKEDMNEFKWLKQEFHLERFKTQNVSRIL